MGLFSSISSGLSSVGDSLGLTGGAGTSGSGSGGSGGSGGTFWSGPSDFFGDGGDSGATEFLENQTQEAQTGLDRLTGDAYLESDLGLDGSGGGGGSSIFSADYWRDTGETLLGESATSEVEQGLETLGSETLPSALGEVVMNEGKEVADNAVNRYDTGNQSGEDPIRKVANRLTRPFAQSSTQNALKTPVAKGSGITVRTMLFLGLGALAILAIGSLD